MSPFLNWSFVSTHPMQRFDTHSRFVSSAEKSLTDSDILARDMQWLSQSQVVVAEVTQPSLGVGFVLRGLAPVISEGISFDLHAAAQLIAPRTMRKDDPTDPVGDVTIGGRVFDVGATIGLIF